MENVQVWNEECLFYPAKLKRFRSSFVLSFFNKQYQQGCLNLIKRGISVDWLTEYKEQRLYKGLINALGQLIENTVIKVFTYNTTLISGKKQSHGWTNGQSVIQCRYSMERLTDGHFKPVSRFAINNSSD